MRIAIEITFLATYGVAKRSPMGNNIPFIPHILPALYVWFVVVVVVTVVVLVVIIIKFEIVKIIIVIE